MQQCYLAIKIVKTRCVMANSHSAMLGVRVCLIQAPTSMDRQTARRCRLRWLTAITGFSLTPCTGTCPFSTSTQVIGSVFAADYGPPTPVNMTTAISDMQTAYVSAAGRAPGVTELGAGNISGMTLSPGVYKWSTGLLIATDVTLQGACSDVWIFEVAQDLTVSNDAHVLLAGGAEPQHIFWQVGGGVGVTIGSNAVMEGNVLALAGINLGTLASSEGRLLAQTAVTLLQNTVVQPAQ
jgi:Ice-binding-like